MVIVGRAGVGVPPPGPPGQARRATDIYLPGPVICATFPREWGRPGAASGVTAFGGGKWAGTSSPAAPRQPTGATCVTGRSPAPLARRLIAGAWIGTARARPAGLAEAAAASGPLHLLGDPLRDRIRRLEENLAIVDAALADATPREVAALIPPSPGSGGRHLEAHPGSVAEGGRRP